MDDTTAMRHAIALSAAGLGTTSPNPPVGCVILDASGALVGEGYHERKGESHAEIRALDSAGNAANGATAFVTLEPCNHYGRTPPCHQALVDAGIRRVVVAVIDPTSRGIGGVARLRDAGVQVDVGLLDQEAHLVLGHWLAATRRQRPVITYGYAITEQGRGPLDLGTSDDRDLPRNFDAVLDDTHVAREAVAHSHGTNALSLPTELSPSPQEAVAELFHAGVRTALVHGTPELGLRWLNEDLVDEIILRLPHSAKYDRAALPSDFTINHIAPEEHSTRIYATKIDKN